MYPKNSFETTLAQEISSLVEKVWGIKDQEILLEAPRDIAHGDIACNIALQISKQVGKNPREIAETIQKELPTRDEISKIEIAGPGFLNFFLSNSFLLETINEIGEDFGKNIVEKQKTIITDISHPNAAKPMGIHHLLSTVIGDVINNVFEHVGHKLTRDSYWGDWGTQFGKLIYAYKEWGDEGAVKQDPIPELLKLYVEFHNKAESDPSLEDKGRAEFKKIEDGDEENTKLWQWIVDLSKEEFFKLYKRLDIQFDVYQGESFYIPLIAAILEEGKKQGIFVEGEEGALVVKFEDENIPTCPIVKSDGATLYHTRDIARIKYWREETKPDLLLYVVDVAQRMHFIQLFEMAKMLGWTDTEYAHAIFGRMSFKDKKMSTRKGNIMLMEDVLNESSKKAHDLIEEKDSPLSNNEKEELAEMMGIGSVKYGILSQNRVTDIVFDWEKIISFDGNSAPYIQYTHARCASVFRKAEEESVDINGEISEQHSFGDKERHIINLIRRLPHTLLTASEEYFPHLVCTHLYELSQAFNNFYNSESILFNDDKNVTLARMKLVEATKNTIKVGMNILGIQVPEKM